MNLNNSKLKKILKKIHASVACKFFILNGMKPWTFGYDVYKKREIIKSLRSGTIDNLNGKFGSRLDERIVEYSWLFSRLPELPGNLLDAGSVLNYDYLLFDDKLKTKKKFIITLAPESNCFWNTGISYIYEDLRDICIKNGYFDWIVSLSTIEHIGLDNTTLYTNDYTKKENLPSSYLTTIKEFHRVLKPNGILYLSFPYGRFKDHGWFQVFNSKMLDSVIDAFSPKSIKENHFKYENNSWQLSSRELSENCTYFDIHTQKKYDADYAAASRAVVCLELVK